MKKKWNVALYMLLLFFVSRCSVALEKNTVHIGLLIVATGKYIQFVDPLIKSAQNYFCTDQKVTYFVFTDGNLQKTDTIIPIFQKRLGWPLDTMMRFAMYAQHPAELESMDYLFACDADMLFVDTVGTEILGDRVATLHPGFVGKRGTYETSSQSTAYISPGEGKAYYAGGFNGGNSAEFLKMAHTITKNIFTDLEKNIIAVWHDESHLNRYLVTHEPTLVLTPSCCYPQDHHLPYHPRLIALNKNHAQMRG